MQEARNPAKDDNETPAGELAPPQTSSPQQPAPGPAERTESAAAPTLEEQLKKAELAAAEHHDAWLRARAESENIRKRAQIDIAAAHKFAVEGFAAELLAVKDSLEAALASENASAESMKSGVEITLKQLAAAFERFSLTEIQPLGQKFDPHCHQAISTAPSDTDPNTVVQVLQKGYRLHDRVIRPALVIVSKAKDA